MPFNKAQEKSTEDKPIFSSQLYFSTVLMYLKNAQEYTLTISWPATNSKLLPSSRPNLSQKKKKKKEGRWLQENKQWKVKYDLQNS